MRVHHLNCISTCPIGGHLMDGRTRSIVERGTLANHCLLVESSDGLVLVDTGLGLRDVAAPSRRLSRFFLALLRPDFREAMTAARQIEAMGFSASDVRHIVMTHLDFDHAGGLDDLPRATVHLLDDEMRSAVARRSILDRMRYRPQQWSSSPRWVGYRAGEGEPWLGFDCVRALQGVTEDIVLVPLIGHTLGHCGVAVRQRDGWLFLAGDAYFDHRELDREQPRCTPGLRFYQWLLEKDRRARLWNQERLRDLVAKDRRIDVFCSHDLAELERHTGRPARIPLDALVGEPALSV